MGNTTKKQSKSGQTSQGSGSGTTKPSVVGPRDKIKQKVKDLLKQAEEFKKRMPEFEKNAEEKISHAKSRLMQREPFFAMLLFKLPTYPCYQVPTMGTDGTILLYNPVWVSEELLRKDVMFILLHEIEHIFFKHNIRGPIKSVNAGAILQRQADLKQKGAKDVFLDDEVKRMQHKLKEWNFATDFTINEHNDKNVKIPITKALKEKLLFNKDYTDWTSEQVYEKIKTEYDPEGDKDGQAGTGINGDDDDPMGMGIGGVLPIGFGELSKEEVEILNKEFESDVKSAALSSKQAGTLPGGVEQTIESLYTTTTPWQDIIRTVLTTINKQDYTFQYPNKRYTQHMMDYGVIMPSLWGEEYCNMGFLIDTSGSMGERERQLCASELRNILEDYNINIHVLCCDTKAYTDKVEILSREDIRNGKLEVPMHGGGGTYMRPGFDYYREHMDEFDFEIVVCMTDMYLGDWGRLGKKPPFSVYWLRLPGSKDIKPDFGTVIDMVIEGDK